MSRPRRCRNSSATRGVRPISGINISAVLPRWSVASMRHRYTSVFPLPVTPCNKAGTNDSTGQGIEQFLQHSDLFRGMRCAGWKLGWSTTALEGIATDCFTRKNYQTSPVQTVQCRRRNRQFFQECRHGHWLRASSSELERLCVAERLVSRFRRPPDLKATLFWKRGAHGGFCQLVLNLYALVEDQAGANHARRSRIRRVGRVP